MHTLGGKIKQDTHLVRATDTHKVFIALAYEHRRNADNQVYRKKTKKINAETHVK